MVMQGPRHPARNFMAWLSRIPEVALSVDVIIVVASCHFRARRVPQRKPRSQSDKANGINTSARENACAMRCFTQDRVRLRRKPYLRAAEADAGAGERRHKRYPPMLTAGSATGL